MLRLLRQLSKCFTAQQVHIGSLGKPQCSSADSRHHLAPYSACSEHLVCSVKVGGVQGDGWQLLLVGPALCLPPALTKRWAGQ
jgi:hypothetical protein